MAPVKKDTIQTIKKHFEISNSYDELTENGVSFELVKNRSAFRYGFEIEQDAFCCGVYSLGSFHINQNSLEFTEKEKIALIKEGLGRVINVVKYNKKEITLMFTTIKNQHCDLIDKAVSDGELFTLVKTFTNLNSGVINKLYISN